MNASQTSTSDTPHPPGVTTDSAQLLQNCPACNIGIDVTDREPLSSAACPDCGAEFVIGEWVDHYHLLAVAGRGGMGVVYRACDTSLDREVALKVLRKDRLTNEAIASLETEAAITASINHPHVVKVFTTGSDRGRFYIAMELVDKGTLDDLIRIQSRVAETQALEVAIQVADGLRAAAQHGLIHRDVKPGNILFADSHTAKIVDFGLAMLEEAAASAAGGEIWGTPYYVAPEKLDQQPEDFRSDIYSLGATLFHALAGRPPFEAEDATMVALKHLKSQAVSLQAFAPWVSGSTAYVINRTLLKDPNERYQSYDELIEHLIYARNELLANNAQPAEKKRVVLETEEDQKRWSYFTFGAIGVCLLLCAGFFFFLNRPSGGTKKVSFAGADAAHSAQYETARRALLAGKTADAEKAFQILVADRKTPAPLRQWALVHEGIGQLLQDRVPEANATFGALQSDFYAGKDTAGRKLQAFFQDLGKAASGDGPVPPTAAHDFDKSDYGALALLVFGVKNWDLGQVDSGGSFLRDFASSPRNNEFSWVSDEKTLAGEYISDLTDVRGAIAVLKSAKTSADVVKAKADLQAVKEQLHHGEGLASRIDAALNDDSNSPESQLIAINDQREQLANLCRKGEFAEARDALKKLEASEPPAQREKFALLRKLDWLVEFKETLAADVAAHGCSVPLRRTDGSEIKGEVKSISGPGIELKSGSPVEWSKVLPESLIGLAKSLAQTAGSNPAQAARRTWLAGIYGLLSGKKEEARTLLEDAAKTRPDYADALPLVLPAAPINLARGADATASGSVINKDHVETPDRAIDGSTATKWCVDEATPQWLRLDLHKETKINRWVVKHAQSGGESPEFNTVDFALEKSSDSKSWSKVDAVNGNTAEVTSRDVKPFQDRYVRLHITKATRNGNHSTRICEFELYGPASSEIPDLFAALQSSPAPHLEATNIGLDPGPAGGSSETDDNTGLLTVHALGSDIWFAKDAGRFLARKLAGNGELIARVESIGHANPWSKSGLMFRASLAPEAQNVYLCASAENGVSLQVRKENGKDSDSSHDGTHPTPIWLKLVRKGDVFTGFASEDGVAWNQVGDPQTVAMGAEVYAGIAATSHEDGKQSESKLDEIQINAE